MSEPGLQTLHSLRLRVPASRIAAALLCAGLLSLGTSAFSAASVGGIDPLRQAAPAVDLKLPAPVLGVARAGDALIGVGPHGLIQRSTDNGRSWKQVPCPVSSDLVQVRFSDARNGWIVGHDSLLLHSQDGGASWAVQLDGRSVLTLLRGSYGKRVSQGDQAAQDMLGELDLAMGTSATADVLAAPFLDVLFNTDGKGFVVGAFGMILYSGDFGATWEPWIEHSENDRRMHLYALAEHAGVFYVSGEQGLLMRLDPATQRFVALQTPYGGTYFSVYVDDGLLLALGLRGNLYASRDEGQTWQKVETGLSASLVSTVEQGEALVVISQGGQMVALDRQTLRVTPLQATRGGDVYAASATGSTGELLLTRFSGTQVIEIAKAE